MTSTYGSTWRRWDLHVHSPASILNQQFPGATDQERWDTYLDRLEELDQISGLGITDYFSVEGYLRVAAERNGGRLTNIDFLFPNIELRITPITTGERAINIHILAAPEIASELDTMLFGNLEFEYSGNTYRCLRPDLIRLGKAVEGNHSLDDSRAFRLGINQFKTNAGQIRKAIRSNRRLKENILIVVPNRSSDGNSGIQQDAMTATRQEIYRLSHAIFSSNPSDREYFLGKGVDTEQEVAVKCGGLKPCIHGSDAHTLERIGEPDEQRYTWIKADPTFEGLRQICHEPEFRVHINATRPNEPFHRIDCLTYDFPSDAKISSDEYSDQFCLSGTGKIYFAPGLTCIIGGRGSGKSTILNLLQEGLTGKSAFFRNNTVTSGQEPLEVSKHVSIKMVGSPEGVEFLTQNEVEQFAADQERLTAAIYTRLRRLDADGSLKNAELALDSHLSTLSRLAELVLVEQRLSIRLDGVRSQIATNQNLVQSLEDPAYTTMTRAAGLVADQLSAERASRQRLREVVAKVEQAVGQERSRSTSGSITEFDKRRETFLDAIAAALQQAKAGADLDSPSQLESELFERANGLQLQLEAYLSERQISVENIQDLSRAASQLATLNEELTHVNDALGHVRFEWDGLPRIETARATYEAALLGAMEPVNRKLQTMGPEVSRIDLQYRFDHEAAVQALLQDLAERLGAHAESGRAPRLDHIASMFGDIDVLDPPPKEELISRLSAGKPSQKTLQLLLDHFQDDFNYRAFTLRAQRAASDAPKFRRIRVAYDGKPLQNASFGQRCSAALILLLTLGNTPIIIDEPEAHLDSALIADLLVVLIKVIKADRQIIFATHNANFVVNGDAELIHILAMDGSRRTTIVPTTLENVAHRPRILALEGGQKAFQQREERYGMRHIVE